MNRPMMKWSEDMKKIVKNCGMTLALLGLSWAGARPSAFGADCRHVYTDPNQTRLEQILEAQPDHVVGNVYHLYQALLATPSSTEIQAFLPPAAVYEILADEEMVYFSSRIQTLLAQVSAAQHSSQYPRML